MNEIPIDFDFKKSRIMFIYDPVQIVTNANSPELNKFLKVITRQTEMCPSFKYDVVEDYLEAEGEPAWDREYGENARLGKLWLGEADIQNPIFPYDGPTALSASEQTAVYDWLKGWRSDFSIAMLYDMVEGFNWKPGSCKTISEFPPMENLVEFYQRYVGNDPVCTLEYVLSLMSWGSEAISSDKIRELAKHVRNVYKEMVSHSESN